MVLHTLEVMELKMLRCVYKGPVFQNYLGGRGQRMFPKT